MGMTQSPKPLRGSSLAIAGVVAAAGVLVWLEGGLSTAPTAVGPSATTLPTEAGATSLVADPWTPTPDADDPIDATVPDGWHTYTNDVGGFTVAVPSHWAPAEFNWETAFRVDGRIALLISTGTGDGWMTLCSAGPCRVMRFDGINGLDAAIRSVRPREGRLPEQTLDVALDGWPARIKAPASGLLDGPPAYVHVYGMLGPRPVVLRFPYSYRSQDLPTAMQLRVIRSFRLASSPPRPMIDPQTGLRVGKDNR
jgi:hypothetical protein